MTDSGPASPFPFRGGAARLGVAKQCLVAAGWGARVTRQAWITGPTPDPSPEGEGSLGGGDAQHRSRSEKSPRCEHHPQPPPLKRRGLFQLSAVVLIAASASPAIAKKQPKPDYTASLPAPVPVAPANGGIFQAGAGYAALHEGLRARAVGDPLIILLVERTTTSKSVGADSKKDGGIALVPPASGPFSFLSPEALKASSNSSFNGEGNASQTNSLAGTLSVTIAEVRSNGTALVKGEKRMLLSQGREWIQFSGIVRLADIDTENRIASSRVADARIEYAGKGALHNSSKQGWLGRFFGMINPF